MYFGNSSHFALYRMDYLRECSYLLNPGLRMHGTGTDVCVEGGGGLLANIVTKII